MERWRVCIRDHPSHRVLAQNRVLVLLNFLELSVTVFTQALILLLYWLVHSSYHRVGRIMLHISLNVVSLIVIMVRNIRNVLCHLLFSNWIVFQMAVLQQLLVLLHQLMLLDIITDARNCLVRPRTSFIFVLARTAAFLCWHKVDNARVRCVGLSFFQNYTFALWGVLPAENFPSATTSQLLTWAWWIGRHLRFRLDRYFWFNWWLLNHDLVCAQEHFEWFEHIVIIMHYFVDLPHSSNVVISTINHHIYYFHFGLRKHFVKSKAV